jgi:hypothetical protein
VGFGVPRLRRMTQRRRWPTWRSCSPDRQSGEAAGAVRGRPGWPAMRATGLQDDARCSPIRFRTPPLLAATGANAGDVGAVPDGVRPARCIFLRAWTQNLHCSC